MEENYKNNKNNFAKTILLLGVILFIIATYFFITIQHDKTEMEKITNEFWGWYKGKIEEYYPDNIPLINLNIYSEEIEDGTNYYFHVSYIDEISVKNALKSSNQHEFANKVAKALEEKYFVKQIGIIGIIMIIVSVIIIHSISKNKMKLKNEENLKRE